jgi:hypothetical protein
VPEYTLKTQLFGREPMSMVSTVAITISCLVLQESAITIYKKASFNDLDFIKLFLIEKIRIFFPDNQLFK